MNKEDASSIEKKSCTCNEEDTELHSCPFKMEIYDDAESECTCCRFCEHECAMEI